MANLRTNANLFRQPVIPNLINAGARPGIKHSARKVKTQQVKGRIVAESLLLALASYQPRLKSKVDLLLAQLEQREGEPVNVSNWAMFFAFDVMGDLGFGKDFHMLEKGKEDEATKGIHNNMAAFGILYHVIWLLHWMITIPGLGGAVAKFRDWCETQVVEKQQVRILTWINYRTDEVGAY
jgi:hypothetical protein